MTVQNLANAPLIDTDIPTSDAYYTKTITLNSEGEVAGTTQVDINRPYLLGSDQSSIMSMDNVPNSFGIDDTQKGIIAVFNTQDYAGNVTLRAAMRKPTATLRDFTTGWDQLPEVSLSIPIANAGVTYSGGGAVASQRQGQYAYVFMQYTRNGIFTDTLFTQVYKITRNEYVETAGISGGQQVLFGDNTNAAVPLIQAIQGGQFFVSDEEQPFIWNVYGGVQGSTIGILGEGGQIAATASVTGFRDDDSQNIGYKNYSGNSGEQEDFYGQAAAYFQLHALPTGWHGFGPFLVHPWASGSYNPPELWYLVTEFDADGNTTGRFTIYHAKWKKGEYQKPVGVTFGDDPSYEAGTIPFPSLNQLGYAFEHDCFDDAHKLGVVGPFQGSPGLYNPASGIMANLQNTSNTSLGGGLYPLNYPGRQPLGFAIVRDKKRVNTLHLVATDGGATPTNFNSINRIWYANSSDDGQSWGLLTPTGPAITPSTQGTPGSSGTVMSRTAIPTQFGLLRSDYVGYYDYNEIGSVSYPPVVRTHDDVLLMGNLIRQVNYEFGDGSAPPQHTYPPDTGARISLAVIDYTGLGAANSARNGVVFVQKTQAGQTAWQ